MKLESPIQPINKSTQEVFEFLNNLKNFEKLMPENTSKFEMIDENSFVFALFGMPEVALKKREELAPNKLVLGAAGGKLDFNLDINISEVSDTSSEAKFIFTGDFNAMIGMMIKGPISKMIETWVTNIPKKI